MLRPGGVLFAAAISRWASALDAVARDLFARPGHAAVVAHPIQDGQHRNTKGQVALGEHICDALGSYPCGHTSAPRPHRGIRSASRLGSGRPPLVCALATFCTGIELVTARKKVHVAHALQNLPQIDEAMSRGELSFAKVRALTRTATAGTEVERERERHRWRSFSVFPDGTGMHEVRGRLDPEVAAVLMRAVDGCGRCAVRVHQLGRGGSSRSSGGPMRWARWPSARSRPGSVR